jgi:hypothetical protein
MNSRQYGNEELCQDVFGKCLAGVTDVGKQIFLVKFKTWNLGSQQ